jgi:hypothetical protein
MEKLLFIAPAVALLVGGAALLAKNLRPFGVLGREISVSFDQLKARENRKSQ